MPSLLQISTSRSAQLMNAPIAQMVISCHRPPSFSGANDSPYSMGGASMEIRNGFHTPSIAVP